MRPVLRSTAAAAVLAAVAVVASVAAALASAYAVAKARLPYNELGRYFDGLTVHHSSSALAYGVLALALWGLGLWAGWAASARFRRGGVVGKRGATRR